MKPAWDRLMDEFKDSQTALVADVDCTVEESLCSKHNVEGFPTIKYGDPAALQDYEGGRDFDELKEFASANLGPVCGLKTMEHCSEQVKAEIAATQKLSNDEIKDRLQTKKEAIKAVESKFEVEVEKLSATYEKLLKEKDEQVKLLKKEGDSTNPSINVLKMVSTERGLDPPPEEDDDAFDPEGEGEYEDDDEFPEEADDDGADGGDEL